MHLTERALAVAVLAGLLAIAGLWLIDASLLRLAGVLFALLLGGLAWEAYAWPRRRPSIAVRAGHASLGRACRVSLEWRAPRGRRLRVEYVPPLPAGALGDGGVRELVLAADAATASECEFTPRVLGPTPLPPVRHRVLGPFGLAWWTGAAGGGASLEVGPDLRSLDARQRGGARLGANVARIARAGFEFVQLRDWRDGDSPRAIDWRATARRGTLIAREYADDQHLEILVLVDAGSRSALEIDGLARLAHYANATARLAERALLRDDRLSLLVYAERPLLRMRVARGAQGLVAVQRAFATLRPSPAESDPVMAALEARALAQSRSLVCLMSDVDAEHEDAGLARAVRLLQPPHQPLVASLVSGEVEALRARPPVTRHDAWLGVAADDHLDGLRRGAARLRLAGVPVVLARPASFERAVLAAYDDLRARRRV